MSGYLPEGLPIPVAEDLDAPFWEGLRKEQLLVQRCRACGTWQWGPEWCCHRCHSFDVGFEEVESTGVIYSHERVWHPVHPALKDHGPYVIVLVELPQAGGVRFVGNLVGDPMQQLVIGAAVDAVFEHHEGEHPHTLLQWRVR